MINLTGLETVQCTPSLLITIESGLLNEIGLPVGVRLGLGYVFVCETTLFLHVDTNADI